MKITKVDTVVCARKDSSKGTTVFSAWIAMNAQRRQHRANKNAKTPLVDIGVRAMLDSNCRKMAKLAKVPKSYDLHNPVFW